MMFFCSSPDARAGVHSRSGGLDMKVSTHEKQGATQRTRGGAKGDNSA